MSIAAEPNTGTDKDSGGAVERAVRAAIGDASRIGDLLDVLRTARLWLPLPDDGTPRIRGTALTLPIVSYLGSEFVPAYSSASMLARFAGRASGPHQLAGPGDQATGPDPAGPDPAGPDPAGPDPAGPDPAGGIPHAVVRAADLARLLPPAVGIALNAGATESVPVYPQAVSYLAEAGVDDDGQLDVGALPVRPDALLAGVAAGLLGIPAVRAASAAWLSVRFAGEGLLISVTLDDPADEKARDQAAGAVERAAWEVTPQEAGFPIDVIFAGQVPGDWLDEQVGAVGTSFYRRDR